MDAHRVAFNTWQEKTEWVQKDKRFDVLLPWGKHRADVLKEYIDHLEAKCAALLDELEAAEKKTVEMPTFGGYVPHVARELQAAFRIACDNAGINVAAAGKGEAS